MRIIRFLTLWLLRELDGLEQQVAAQKVGLELEACAPLPRSGLPQGASGIQGPHHIQPTAPWLVQKPWCSRRTTALGTPAHGPHSPVGRGSCQFRWGGCLQGASWDRGVTLHLLPCALNHHLDLGFPVTCLPCVIPDQVTSTAGDIPFLGPYSPL